MGNIGNFDANQVDPSESFDPLPAGEYKAMIVASEERDTKAGTGSYINLEYEIIEGVYRGRKVWQVLNLNNPSEQAREIAFRELSAICHAINKLNVQDSSELHDTPLTIRLKIKQQEGYEPKNRVVSWKSASQQSTSPAATTPSAPAQAATSTPPDAVRTGGGSDSGGGGTPPWKR